MTKKILILLYVFFQIQAQMALADFDLIDTKTHIAKNNREFVQKIMDEDVDIVFLGEIHDNPIHHQIQTSIVEQLNKTQPVQALVFEMIAPEQEQQANQALAISVRAVAEALNWAKSGWPDFSLYAPIIEAAPQAQLMGGWVPRQALMPLITSEDPVKLLNQDPDIQALDIGGPLPAAEQTAREQKQIAAHCHQIPASVAKVMVYAQRLRDARLAMAALRAKKIATHQPVMVITGTQHARKDIGAAAALLKADPALKVISIGMREGATPVKSEITALAQQFDFVITTPTPSPPRPDPCEAFQKR